MINVRFYTKSYSRCGSCDAMKTTLAHWEEEHPEADLTVEFLSAEDNIGYIHDNYPNVQEAPVVEITRGRKFNVVSGNNPDILVDYLNGLDSVWDEA